MSNDQYHGGQPYDPYANGQVQGHGGFPAQAPQGADAAQTWEGQTWDTTYQPSLSPEQVRAARAQAPQEAPAPQGYGGQAPSHGGQAPSHGGQAPSYGGQAPSYGGQQQPYAGQNPYAGQQPYGGQNPYAGQDPHAAPPSYGGGQDPYGAQPSHGAPQSPYGAPQPYGTQDPYGTQRQYGAQQSYGAPAPVDAYPPRAAETPAPEPVREADPAPGADRESSWSSPTTSGNTRITDAQRARAEGRSPVIEPGMRPAVLTAVLGLLLAGGAALGTYGLLVPVVLLQGLTAAGWFRLNGMWPARQGIALAFAGGLAADAALLATGREHAAAAILGTLGAWVLLCLVLQLRSHADPDERMYGLMATVVSAALAVVATGHLGADPDAVVVGGTAVAAAVLARALPLPGAVSAVVALLASAGAGIAAGGLTGLGTSGALLGLGAGVCALIGLRVASYDYPSRFVHMTAGVALPLAAAAPAVYLLGRTLA
ncbi:hypothetical protein [Streptomyces sp. NPDC059247]|uniref:hypothetical protein n=1 Tax=Streptomyces sp. NPDC059247 TaxID=3346790 RepID=UPI0036AC8B36